MKALVAVHRFGGADAVQGSDHMAVGTHLRRLRRRLEKLFDLHERG